MTIAENVIARLKTEAAESSTEDFQIGYNAGKDWAADASFADIRALWSCYQQTDIYAQGGRGDRQELFAFLQNHNPVFRYMSNDDFEEAIGYDDEETVNPNDFAAGFFNAVDDFVKEAKVLGVPF